MCPAVNAIVNADVSIYANLSMFMHLCQRFMRMCPTTGKAGLLLAHVKLEQA